MTTVSGKVNSDTFTGPSFSLKSRIGRLVWGIVQSTLFRLSPRPLHTWRVFLLRCFRAEIGKNVHVYPGVKIWAPWNLEIDDESGVADDVTLYTQGRISIGKRVVISQGCYLCAGTHDFEDPGFPLITKPIRIGDHAWLAAQVFIHPGVTIGEGAVAGARSVVIKDLEPWKVYAGNPATHIKNRKPWE